MKLKGFLKGNKWQIVVLCLVLLIQCVFISQKEGYHMDEILSFQLGNAEYNPWIVPTQPEGRLAKFIHNEIDGENLGETIGNVVDTVKDVLENRGNSKLLSCTADVYDEPVWIDRETFVNYVTVDTSDDFNYLSVYFNVKDDNHPPVHFMLLHTMSSLFKGKVLPFMGCIINVAAVLGICVLFMKLGRLLETHMAGFGGEHGKKLGLLAALLYGVNGGAVATTLLIRMYGVMTFFCVALAYIALKKYLEKDFEKKNQGLILVTIFGFWTQYFFLFYCILLAVVLCLLLWREKRIRELLIYVRSNVIAAVIGVGVWPFSISHVLSSGRGVEAIENLGNDFGEFLARIVSFGRLLLERCFGQELLGVVALLVSLAIVGYASKKVNRKVLLILFVPAVGYYLLAAKVSPFMVDRYIMPVFPFVMLFIAMAICAICAKKRLAFGMTVLCMVASILGYDGTYLYRGYDKQLAMAKENAEYPCICLYEGYGFYDNVLEFAEYERTLLVTPRELLERKNKDSVTELDEFVLLVKQTVNVEDLEKVIEVYNMEVTEVLLPESAHGDKLYLCKVR